LYIYIFTTVGIGISHRPPAIGDMVVDEILVWGIAISCHQDFFIWKNKARRSVESKWWTGGDGRPKLRSQIKFLILPFAKHDERVSPYKEATIKLLKFNHLINRVGGFMCKEIL
jgi:hypothetical protein